MSGRESLESTEGVVFDVQRFCIEDGPGIRTSIFLKGCQLRCPWCSNPESLAPKPQLAHFHSRCVLCGACVSACERQAVRVDGQKLSIDRGSCSDCGQCVSVCAHGAMKIIGRKVSCSDVIEECLRDKPFYEESGGGITLTGGEPTLQAAFSAALLEVAHAAGVHTAVETNGYCSWPDLERLARHTDLFLFDLKIIENTKSRGVTGAESAVILENLRRVKAMGRNTIIRFPYIPGYTDCADNIGKMLEVASSLGNAAEVHVLPFHQYGKHKYDALGHAYALRACPPPSREQILSIFSEYEYPGTIQVLG
jgi:pyruvate formate lyase activating enzyme